MAYKFKYEINMYVDDIPMKLSQKFRPLDFSEFTNDTIETPEFSEENYDFNVEMYALEVAELRERRQQEELRKKCDSPKAKEINSDPNCDSSVTKATMENSCDDHNTTEDDAKNDLNATTINSEQAKSLVPSLHHHVNYGTILQPLTRNVSNDIIKSRSVEPTFKTVKSINPRDFENDTSSPFDNVELQTIDDMSELSSVFQ